MYVNYHKIAENGGSYNTKEYRYVIDPSSGEVLRIRLSKLGTTAALDPRSWERCTRSVLNAENLVRTSVQIPRNEYNWLKAISKKYGHSISDYIRYAIVEYHDKYTGVEDHD